MGGPGGGFAPALGPPDAGSSYVGVQKIVNVPNPAAGSEWSAKVEGGAWWRVLLVAARLVTSATVANRQPSLHIADADGVLLWGWQWSGNLPANSTNDVTWAPGIGGPDRGAGAIVNLPLPELWLPPGAQIIAVTAALQSGDQWSNIRLVVSELDRGPLGEQVGGYAGESF